MPQRADTAPRNPFWVLLRKEGWRNEYDKL